MLCSHLAPLVRINDLGDKRYERLLVVAHSIEYIKHLQVFARVQARGAFNLASQPHKRCGNTESRKTLLINLRQAVSRETIKLKHKIKNHRYQKYSMVWYGAQLVSANLHPSRLSQSILKLPLQVAFFTFTFNNSRSFKIQLTATIGP